MLRAFIDPIPWIKLREIQNIGYNCTVYCTMNGTYAFALFHVTLRDNLLHNQRGQRF